MRRCLYGESDGLVLTSALVLPMPWRLMLTQMSPAFDSSAGSMTTTSESHSKPGTGPTNSTGSE